MAGPGDLQKHIAELEAQNAQLTQRLLAQAQPPPKDDGTSYAVGGLIVAETLGLLFLLIRGSFSRNVQNVDETLKTLNAKSEAHERAVNDLKHDVKQLASIIPEVKGALSELTRATDQAREKQGAFYRSELERLEQTLRQDMTRAVSPDQQLRIHELETKLHEAEGRITHLEAAATRGPPETSRSAPRPGRHGRSR